MLIYEECSTQESIRGGGHPYCLVQLQLLRVCRGFWKPRYGNISQELIQVIAISIVTPGSYPRNGGALEKEGVGAGEAVCGSLGNRCRPCLGSVASGCFGVTERDVREHTCAPVCDHPGWLAKRFVMPRMFSTTWIPAAGTAGTGLPSMTTARFASACLAGARGKGSPNGHEQRD